MFEKIFLYVMEEHRGKALGITLGLLASVLFVTLGFWKAVFVIFCILVGYTFGKKLDDNGDFDRWLKDLFKRN